MTNQLPPTPRLRTPEENLLHRMQYVDAVARTMVLNVPAIARWLTVTCKDCDSDLAAMGPGEVSDHFIISGAVIIACEGYFQVNPVAAGLGTDFAPNWNDWTESYCEGCEREFPRDALDDDLMCPLCAELGRKGLEEDARAHP